MLYTRMRRWRRRYYGALGLADFHDGSGAHQCRVVNHSNGGARLYGFPHHKDVPDLISLYIRDHNVIKRKCRVVWRNAREVGVQFLSPPQTLKLSALAANLKNK